MKALSLWQPWASAIALGHKRIETRHWQTAYRGPIAIHAARRWTAAERAYAEHFAHFMQMPSGYPLGAIVAIARLIDVRPTEELCCQISLREDELGDYSPGRFGWLLQDIRPLVAPIPAKGMQGLFNLTAEVEAQVRT